MLEEGRKNQRRDNWDILGQFGIFCDSLGHFRYWEFGPQPPEDYGVGGRLG